MKKLCFAVVILFAAFTTQAQSKIGSVNYEELVTSMPEYQSAIKELQELQSSLEKQGQELGDEAETKIAQFNKDSATYSESMKEIKRDELIKLIQRVQNYENEAKEKIDAASQQKLGPVEQKAMTAIKDFATKNKYNYIIRSTNLLYGAEEGDITKELKKQMGIKETPAKATDAPKKP
jgi:outer membrane protein